MPANHVRSIWTDDQVFRLKTLWTRGDSAAVIARIMHTSRNAILGKVHRLQLDGRSNRNAHFYTAPCDRKPPKRPVNKSIFPTREQKPPLQIRNPNFKPALAAVTSALTGAIITIKRRPRVPEMTKPELRAMLTQAMVNTGGVLQ